MRIMTTMDPNPAAEPVTNGTSAPRRAERVSVMFGDRLCTTCHYNLIGQPVLREPHYDMLIVRCPECATVACVQEYPQLGRWANRWSIILNVWWLLVILAVTSGAFPAMISMTGVFTEETTNHYENHLRDHHAAWHEATYDAKPTNSWWNPDKFDEWRAAHPEDQLLAEAGGFWGVTRHPEASLFLIPMALAFAYGGFMAVALVHRRRRTLAIMSCAVLMLGATVYGVAWWQLGKMPASRFDDISMLQVFLPLMAMVLGVVWITMTLGAVFGRSIARGLVRVLVPPTMRPSLSVLWTTDGLPPPTVKALPA